MDKELIGKRIKEARKRIGLTQEKLAEKIGIAEVYLSEIERGIKLPSLSTFVDIINALEVSADFVLAGEIKAAGANLGDELSSLLSSVSPKQRLALLEIIKAYVSSV